MFLYHSWNEVVASIQLHKSDIFSIKNVFTFCCILKIIFLVYLSSFQNKIYFPLDIIQWLLRRRNKDLE